MKIKLLKPFEIYHDGINLTQYEAGEYDVTEHYAKRLIDLGAAELVKEKAFNPVVENKQSDPVKVTKRGMRKDA